MAYKKLIGYLLHDIGHRTQEAKWSGVVKLNWYGRRNQLALAALIYFDGE